MGCGSFGVSAVLVGLHRVGIVGLRNALEKADQSGLVDRKAILDLVIDILAVDNYIPEGQKDSFRTAIWREYLRYKGEDFSAFYSEVDVTVRAQPGEERDRFVDTLRSVFRDFELRPVITFVSESKQGANPQLVIGDEIIVRGCPDRQSFKAAVRKSISDW
jgi:hypothetical protein